MNEKQQKEERKKERKKTEVRLSQKRRQTLGARHNKLHFLKYKETKNPQQNT